MLRQPHRSTLTVVRLTFLRSELMNRSLSEISSKLLKLVKNIIVTLSSTS